MGYRPLTEPKRPNACLPVRHNDTVKKIVDAVKKALGSGALGGIGEKITGALGGIFGKKKDDEKKDDEKKDDEKKDE